MNSDEKIKPLVFISHAASQDKDIAKAFQEWILLAYEHKVDVFVSSTNGIKPTAMPSPELQAALDRAAVFLILHTPHSVDRPWISYESGWSKGGKKVSLHILCKGAKADSVASPITSMSEVKDSGDCDQFYEVIRTLNANLHMDNEKSFEELRQTLSNGTGTESKRSDSNHKSNISFPEVGLSDFERKMISGANAEKQGLTPEEKRMACTFKGSRNFGRL